MKKRLCELIKLYEVLKIEYNIIGVFKADGSFGYKILLKENIKMVKYPFLLIDDKYNIDIIKKINPFVDIDDNHIVSRDEWADSLDISKLIKISDIDNIKEETSVEKNYMEYIKSEEYFKELLKGLKYLKFDQSYYDEYIKLHSVKRKNILDCTLDLVRMYGDFDIVMTDRYIAINDIFCETSNGDTLDITFPIVIHAIAYKKDSFENLYELYKINLHNSENIIYNKEEKFRMLDKAISSKFK